MIGWVILGALIAWALARVFAGYPAPRERHAGLLRQESIFLEAAAEAVYPQGGAVPTSGIEAAIPGHTDRYLSASSVRLRVLMRMLFFLVEHATLFFPAPGWLGWRRFSKLTPEKRIAVLDGWSSSRLFPRRLVFMSLRAVLTMGYFGSPPVLRTLRLAPLSIPSPVVEADLLYPRIGEAQSRYGPEDRTPPSDGTPQDLDGPLDPAFAEVCP